MGKAKLEEANQKGGGGAKKAATVASKFKQQLSGLMEAIEKTDPHFVRCIKPNPKNKPDLFDRGGVTEQLRYQGVLQVVQLSRAGYPVRLPMSEVWFLYKCSAKLAFQREIEKLEA